MRSAQLLSLLPLLAPGLAEVALKSAVPYGVLSDAPVTSTGQTVVNGDAGSLTRVSGVTATGNITMGSAASQPESDALAAGTVVRGMQIENTVPEDFTGEVFTPGSYKWVRDASLDGEVTLSGSGFFFFQIAGSLNTTDGSAVVLAGASANQVFWEVGDKTTFGAANTWSGTVVSAGSLVAGTGSTFDGGLFSGGSITLSSNTITATNFTDPNAV